MSRGLWYWYRTHIRSLHLPRDCYIEARESRCCSRSHVTSNVSAARASHGPSLALRPIESSSAGYRCVRWKGGDHPSIAPPPTGLNHEENAAHSLLHDGSDSGLLGVGEIE